MPIKIINLNFTAQVLRDGNTVTVKKGEPFDFTEDEIEDLEKAHGDEALRDPVNEGEMTKPKAAGKAAKGKAAGAQTAGDEI